MPEGIPRAESSSARVNDFWRNRSDVMEPSRRLYLNPAPLRFGGDGAVCFADLGQQHFEGWHIVVPLDEGRDRTCPAKRMFEEPPDDLGNRRSVRINEERIAFVVDVLSKARQMDLLDAVRWKGVQVSDRVVGIVDR